MSDTPAFKVDSRGFHDPCGRGGIGSCDDAVEESSGFIPLSESEIEDLL